MKIVQTAGRQALGKFAPKFAQLNDDVLFGEVWSGDGLSPKIRSMLTVTTLVAKGLVDSSFEHHLRFAKQNGVTKAEMADLLTHVAFYAVGPTHGRHSARQWKCTPTMTASAAACLGLASLTRRTQSILSAIPISIRLPRRAKRCLWQT